MKKLVRGVQWGFAFVFALTAAASAFYSFLAPKNGADHIDPHFSMRALLALVCGTALCFLLPALYGFLEKKTSGFSQKKFDICFCAIAAAVFVWQVISLFFLRSEPVNDLKYINSAAGEFFKNWDPTAIYKDLPKRHQVYFIRYPNNHLLLVMVSLIYKVCYTLFGKTPIIVPMFVNLLALFASYVMVYFIAKQLFGGGFKPVFCSLMAAFFNAFYTYTPFFYTDSMSMPFVTASVLAFLVVTKDGARPLKKALMMFLSAMFMVVGYKMKGSVIVLIPAYILYLVAFCKKDNFKVKLFEGGTFVASAAAAALICHMFLSFFPVATAQQKEEYEFPAVHWIMMGLRNPGGYNDDDFLYTNSFDGKEERAAADIKVIKERLSGYGLKGLAEHLLIKSSYAWHDGKYFVTKYLVTGQTNAFKRFITRSSVFFVYCNAYQFALLIGILASFLYGAKTHGKDQAADRELLLRIILCGVYFFFLIWEARSRYLVNFMPLFVILAASSAAKASDRRKKHRASAD